MDPRVIIVAAIAENNVIGHNNDLPWHLKSDLARFKILTEGGTVIMGRRTHESILHRLGKPLPHRTTVVLTSRPLDRSDCYAHADLQSAFSQHNASDGRVFIIGGASVYQAALQFADELHLTIIHAHPKGDAYFPSLSGLPFEQTDMMRFDANLDVGDEHGFSFAIFHRRNKPMPASMVYLQNARKPKQWAIMERIQLDGVCPFCPEYRARYHKRPTLSETADWTLTENQWPYENTKHHLLIIHRRHVERLVELQDHDWEDLGVLVRFAERQFGFRSGGLGLRFGDPAGNGGTVRHLHWQLIESAITDRTNPKFQKVRIALN